MKSTIISKSITYKHLLFYPLNYGALVVIVLICLFWGFFVTCNPALSQFDTKYYCDSLQIFYKSDSLVEKTMNYKFVYNRSNRLTTSGNAPLHIYIFKDKIYYFNTKIYLKPTEWDGSKVIRHSDRININNKLIEYEKYLEELETQTKPIDMILYELETIRDGNVLSDELLSWATNRYNHLKLEESTLKQHKLLLSYLEDFNSKLTFTEISYSTVSDFQRYLEKQKDRRYSKNAPYLSNNYVTSILTIFSSYLNEAVREGFISQNPLHELRKKKTVTDKEYLTLDEIKAIEALDIGSRMQGVKDVKNIFLFACYTGLRLVDLQLLRNTDIKDGVMEITPHKTRKHNIKVVLPLKYLFWGKPYKILQEIYLPFTIPGDSRDYISEFTELAGINKKIGWHSARHSCAMNLLDLGFSLSEVQKVLGHKSIQTTEIYARMRNERVSENIINRFKDIEDKTT